MTNNPDYQDDRINCALCKSLFSPYRPYQKYCSNECRNGAHKGCYTYKSKPTKEKKCLSCDKTFLSNDSKRKYCSPNCRLKVNLYTKRKDHKMICPICQKTFMTTSYIKKYCTTLCYKEARRLRNQEYGNQISRLE